MARVLILAKKKKKEKEKKNIDMVLKKFQKENFDIQWIKPKAAKVQNNESSIKSLYLY